MDANATTTKRLLSATKDKYHHLASSTAHSTSINTTERIERRTGRFYFDTKYFQQDVLGYTDVAKGGGFTKPTRDGMLCLDNKPVIHKCRGYLNGDMKVQRDVAELIFTMSGKYEKILCSEVETICLQLRRVYGSYGEILKPHETYTITT